MHREIAEIIVKAGRAADTQSGLQALRPKIWGMLHAPPGARTAAIVIHPTSNFMGHYLLEPLARRGIAALGLNTRYLGNDSVLLLERAIQDLGAGVAWLRAKGYARIVLIGNSGGGALVSLYQAQAERLSIDRTPDGEPIDLVEGDLPRADAIALNAAHLGRSRLMEMWIDPAVVDEHDPRPSNPALDMFDPRNGPPFSREFLERFRIAQRRRLAHIDRWVRGTLAQMRAVADGPRDMAFVIHRTLADPRCLDPSIDPNDREPGTTVWGPPLAQNHSANSMGRFTTLTGFLSQWSPGSRGDGPRNLAQTSVPLLLVEHTADSSVFPADIEEWRRAAAGRARHLQLVGGDHYLRGQAPLVEQLADEIAGFAAGL